MRYPTEGSSAAFGTRARLHVAWISVLCAAAAQGQECQQVLVPAGAEFAYFKGFSEPAPDAFDLPTTDWTLVDFDDAAWQRGPSGFGYGDQLPLLGTRLTDMSGGYWSVYLRHRFEIDDPDAVSALALNVDYDDGFVAYLNGVEIARRGLAGLPPAFDAAATSRESGQPELVLIPTLDMLDTENVLALQVHNTSLGSSDLVMVLELVADPNTCPRNLTCAHDRAAGSITLSWVNQIPAYDAIRIERNGEVLIEDIGGILDTWTDLDPPAGDVTYGVVALDAISPCPECTPLECTLFVQDCSESEVIVQPGDEWTFLRGTFPGPLPDWNTLEFNDADWERGPTGIGYGDGDDRTELLDMRNLYVVVYARKVVEVDTEEVSQLIFSAIVDDGMVVWVNGEEVGRFNVSDDPVRNDTTADAANPQGDPSANPPAIEIAIPPDVLVRGENLIAVSIHNVNLGSSDLSFIPTIIQCGGGPPPPQGSFRRGDIDSSGAADLTDAVFLIRHLFQQGAPPPCADAADTDDSGDLALTDAIRLLNGLFRGQVPLPPPGLLGCGPDPTPDALGSCSSAGC